MLLDVTGSVLQRRPVEFLTFPAEPPPAFGIMQCDGSGTVSWLTQYVSALTPDPSYNYFFTNTLDSTGTATLEPDRALLLRPYSKRVVYGIHLYCRAYDASQAAAVFIQGSITFDPSQPTLSQWSADVSDVYGDSAGLQAQLILTRVLPPAISITVQISAANLAGATMDIDGVLYYPIEIPK